MMYLITGGSGSGKSAFAEELIHKIEPENKIYLATMHSGDSESQMKIEHHQKMREHKKFKTMEYATDIGSIEVREKESILLECLSNLIANEMFDSTGARENTVTKVKKDLEYLKKACNHLVIVGNEIFSDIAIDDSYTNIYMENLANITKFACEQADVVIEVVYGIPIIWKGDSTWKNVNSSFVVS